MNNPYAAPAANMAMVSNERDTYLPNWFAFEGRIGRARYFVYATLAPALLLVGMVILAVSIQLIGPALRLVPLLLYIPVLAIPFVMARRRLNDLDRSGWWSLLHLVPVINLVFWLYLLSARGTDGPNNYGPAPSANTGSVLAGAWIVTPLLALMLWAGHNEYQKVVAMKDRAQTLQTEKKMKHAPPAPVQTPLVSP